MDTRTGFSKRVIVLIQAIPSGKVATYGQIANLAGNPRAARGVSWILHSSSKKYRLPWQRVLKSDGRLAFPELSAAYARQKRLLELEKVFLVHGRVDLKRHLWKGK